MTAAAHTAADEDTVPVLEVGGTHVTAALVTADGHIPTSIRQELNSQAQAADILDTIAGAARHIGAPAGARWGVAVPGPFDCARGVGLFRGMGKFESLHGVDVAAGLRARIQPAPARLCFLNDADAFALGEYHDGAATGHKRALCLTLGTGVGSTFLEEGRPLTQGHNVPPEGRVHRLTVDGLPLEEVVSRQAIRDRYAQMAALPQKHAAPDVREIMAAARGGDAAACDAVGQCFGALGRALAPWLSRFGPQVIVVGGSMAASLDVFGPALLAGLSEDGRHVPSLRPAQRPDQAPLVGAAYWARATATEQQPVAP
ncbi:ROK family protein [Streptomyces avermitilis]|uniref:ROK family protein n=1 Tax=Streptomyces avermitilis TaxID=33903 RepID=UPI0033DCE473